MVHELIITSIYWQSCLKEIWVAWVSVIASGITRHRMKRTWPVVIVWTKGVSYGLKKSGVNRKKELLQNQFKEKQMEFADYQIWEMTKECFLQLFLFFSFQICVFSPFLSSLRNFLSNLCSILSFHFLFLVQVGWNTSCSYTKQSVCQKGTVDRFSPRSIPQKIKEKMLRVGKGNTWASPFQSNQRLICVNQIVFRDFPTKL